MWLQGKLLSELKDKGFNYHSLKELSKQCFRILSDESAHSTEMGNTTIFVVGCVCSRVAENLESREPVDADIHKQIEDVFRPLLESVLKLPANVSSDIKLAALDELVMAEVFTLRIPRPDQ